LAVQIANTTIQAGDTIQLTITASKTPLSYNPWLTLIGTSTSNPLDNCQIRVPLLAANFLNGNFIKDSKPSLDSWTILGNATIGTGKDAVLINDGAQSTANSIILGGNSSTTPSSLTQSFVVNCIGIRVTYTLVCCNNNTNCSNTNAQMGAGNVTANLYIGTSTSPSQVVTLSCTTSTGIFVIQTLNTKSYIGQNAKLTLVSTPASSSPPVYVFGIFYSVQPVFVV